MLSRIHALRRTQGFTLVEIIIVIVVVAVLASIVIPRILKPERPLREAQLQEDLQSLRDALQRFHSDTEVYPQTLADLTMDSAPDYVSKERPFVAPYLHRVPVDPITGAANWSYDSATGELKSSAQGTTLEGVAYGEL